MPLDVASQYNPQAALTEIYKGGSSLLILVAGSSYFKRRNFVNRFEPHNL
jgi:hypothetical protein